MNTLYRILRALDIALRVAFVVIGVLMIAGLFQLRNVGAQLRVFLGVILVLYGAFRIVTLRRKKDKDAEQQP
ncbi:MAG TPA: hypothetical protein VMT60_03895 [Candidatus Bathyarchaeia archaeon]|nr:hypothetical protein [Candidatus Bathyarchaeia archaeon]